MDFMIQSGQYSHFQLSCMGPVDYTGSDEDVLSLYPWADCSGLVDYVVVRNKDSSVRSVAALLSEEADVMTAVASMCSVATELFERGASSNLAISSQTV